MMTAGGLISSTNNEVACHTFSPWLMQIRGNLWN